ncbi:adenosine deaminase family protein [Rothia uropygioeca]|uniref:adenosine deaminase family protein n=1 Tax=Kocuria sp. 257 TaxID=2021970 RepID=UPI001010306E|nr:adenosine deaminase family protein [Kocuria sp. 257]
MSAQVVTPLFDNAYDEGWIASLPKVCLHDHLDGSLRPQTVIELAAEVGHELPYTDQARLERWFSEAADSRSLARYLQTFEHTVGVMRTAEALERVAREYVVDAAADGIIHGEVRWAPEQHLSEGLDLDAAIHAVERGIVAGESDAADRGHIISIRQIVCAMRQNDCSLEVARAAVRNRSSGVVGFDLAGPELGFSAELHREALDYCARHFLQVTLHAGEADGVESIRQALHEGRAARLGHGVRIVEDLTRRQRHAALADNVARLPHSHDVSLVPATSLYSMGEVAAWVRDRRIPLEICPCSNLQTDAAPRVSDIGVTARTGNSSTGWAREYREHPVELLRSLGFAVTINPDNRLMSRTSMTREFLKLAHEFGYERDDFLSVTLIAAESAFLPLDERNDLVDRVLAGYSTSPEVGS